MRKMTFHMGVTLRCYGNVEVEAESVEAAFPLLTADYVGENIEIHETTTDSGQDLAVIDVSDAETGEQLADYAGHSLPSPYDPQPSALELAAPDMLAALKAIKRARGNCGASPFEQDACNLMDAAIAKAEGGAAIQHQAPALPDHVSDTVDALTQAESFISGFEDDELQEGVADILAGLRAAIPREQARPSLLEALKALRLATVPFEDDADLDAAKALADATIAHAEGRTNG